MYVREDGSYRFKASFDGLDAQAAAKVATPIIRVSSGNRSRIKWFAEVGELRIDWGPGYRVYLASEGERVILLLRGGTKQCPQTDIERAKRLHAEHNARKARPSQSRRNRNGGNCR